MATLEINGRRVSVDDSFLSLSPEDQQRTVEDIAAQLGGPAQEATTPERSLGQTIYENVIGSGEVDSPGERLGQAIQETGRAFFPGLARGAAELVGLPGTIGELADVGMEKIGLIPEGGAELARSPLSGRGIRKVLGQVTGGATEYKSEDTIPRIAGTVGEFIGGGAGGRAGLLGGGASELAGMATEGTPYEPYARVGAGIVGSMIGAPRPAFAGDDEAARMANLLEAEGVRDISVGQAKGSQPLMRAEGMLQATPQQIDDFTAATMRQLGSPEKLATPTNLRAVEQSLVKQMDDAVAGVSITPSQSVASEAMRVGADYIERVPAGSLTPRIKGIANQIKSLSASNKPVPLSRLREWRSDVGKLSVSPDAATREAAHGLRTVIDDMTDTALTAAGRSDDIARLAQARSSYRNYVGVRDAATRAGAERGTLSPAALNQSVIRSQGREAYATGRTTPMADFTRAGAATLRPAPAVSPGGARSISEALPMASGAIFGGGALQAGIDPMMAAGIAAGGALAPSAAQGLMRSGPVQSVLRNPLQAALQRSRTLPGLLAQ